MLAKNKQLVGIWSDQSLVLSKSVPSACVPPSRGALEVCEGTSWGVWYRERGVVFRTQGF